MFSKRRAHPSRYIADVPNAPQLHDVRGAILILEDHRGESARYSVDFVGDAVLICGYVFKGRHRSPLALRVGSDYHFGAPVGNGWIAGIVTVTDVGAHETLTLKVMEFALEQRREAYRESVNNEVVVTVPASGRPRRGHTLNLSIGGFAARLDGTPIDNQSLATARLRLGDTDDDIVELRVRKVGGDIDQRFQFIGMDRRVRERLAKVVREAELDKRRRQVR